MNAVREMIRKKKRMGKMIEETVGVKNMVGKVKMFVEGEKKGKREIEIEEMNGVLGVIGEMIVCGVEVGGEDELMRNVRWIEEEGIKREDEEGEEGEGWRKLAEIALMVERRLLKKKGKGMTLGRAMEEMEKDRKERKEINRQIEEMNREIEESKLRVADWQKKAEELMEEVEKLQKENEEEKEENEASAEREEKGKSEDEEVKITSLSSLRLEFGDETCVKRKRNFIRHRGDTGISSCLIGDEMKTVYLFLYDSFLFFSLYLRESIDCFSFLLVLLLCSFSFQNIQDHSLGRRLS